MEARRGTDFLDLEKTRFPTRDDLVDNLRAQGAQKTPQEDLQREAPFWWWCHEEAKSWYAQDSTSDPLRGGTGFRYTDRFGTELVRAGQKERL